MKKTTLALALVSLLCVASAVAAPDFGDVYPTQTNEIGKSYRPNGPQNHEVTLDGTTTEVVDGVTGEVLDNPVITNDAIVVQVGDTVTLEALVKKHGSWVESWGWTDGVTGGAYTFNGVQYVATGEFKATTAGTFEVGFNIVMSTGQAGVTAKNGKPEQKTRFVVGAAVITIIVVAPPEDEDVYVVSVTAGDLTAVGYTLLLHQANNANKKNTSGSVEPQQGWGSVGIPFVVNYSDGTTKDVVFVVNLINNNAGNNMSTTYTVGGQSCTVWYKKEAGSDPDAEQFLYGGVYYTCYELCFASVQGEFGDPVEPTWIKFPNTAAAPFVR